MAATTPDQLFERESYSPVPSTPASPSVRSGGTRTPGGSGSLFDRYASASPASRGSAQTYTSRLRSTGIKLACYLNTECNRGMGCIVSLPEACDTIAEVFPLLQRRMQLDSRMLYAAELFLPDGAKITSFKQLRQAAAIDTAIIVGCGEPFDPTTVPLSMLSFHMKGGGRAAPKVVKKELAEKKFRGAQLKADQARRRGTASMRERLREPLPSPSPLQPHPNPALPPPTRVPGPRIGPWPLVCGRASCARQPPRDQPGGRRLAAP